jgi:6-pyruvoyltetrahydropterin/6-carboxytetrahydropterin synthase
MHAELVRTFRFEAAHALPNLPDEHKCRRMHGHSYRVDIHVTGEVDATTGWVMDFGDIRHAVQPVIDQLDHRYLNDIEGLSNCTSELIAAWLWERLKGPLPAMTAITIWESDNARCVYRGE